MQLVSVKTPQQAKAFLELPVKLYKNEKNWIRPLDLDIEKVFDPKKNKFFKHGECIRWLLYDSNKEVVGRVAAFTNEKTANKGNDQATGGMGFFECVDNQAFAFCLFDACRDWLLERGMKAMDGPVNFGERDAWWGLLVDGFDKPATYNMNYHLPYYRTFFENYGFQVYFNQYTYGRSYKPLESDLIRRIGERVLRNPDYTFEHLKKSQLDKFTEDFRIVYNKAWTKHDGVGEMSSQQARELMGQLKPILDEELVFFGYYKGEAVSFFVIIPDLNEVLGHLNGKMNLVGMGTFMYYKFFRKFKRAIGVAFGVAPEHQNRGVSIGMILEYEKYAFKPNYPYNEMEFIWIGDFNPKMMSMMTEIGCSVTKTHITYRKMFDDFVPFRRATMIK